jgi:hypothetical protein
MGDRQQAVTLTPGLSLYQIPQLELPGSLTLTTQVAADVPVASTVRLPHELPRADVSLFVPWIELREAGQGAEQSMVTKQVLVRCTSAGAGELDARCFVANPEAVTLRWDYVVRGTPKGTEEDQELIRRTAVGSPTEYVDLGGSSLIQFDALSPQQFPARPLPDGNYRAALEIFRGEVLLGRIDLYRFNLAQAGASLKRFNPADPPLLILQP